MNPDQKAMEEERRLCYVGITRARENLYMTSAVSRRQHGNIVCNAASRFLKEIPLELIMKDESVPAKTARKSGVNEAASARPAPAQTKNNYTLSGKVSAAPLDYAPGDKVRQIKYGVGTVTEIRPAGADYEVTVDFPGTGRKKFMAHLSKLNKV